MNALRTAHVSAPAAGATDTAGAIGASGSIGSIDAAGAIGATGSIGAIGATGSIGSIGATAAGPHRRRARASVLVAALLAASVTLGGAAHAGPVEEGRLCLRGAEGVPVNLPKAFKLFSGAAGKGDPLAAYYLGMMYQNGMAVARNMKAAARWMQFAAEHENPAAMFALAKLYLAGEGVKRDEQAARRWIEKAADLEYPEAVMAMAIGLRDGSMGFDRNEALSERQMRLANRFRKSSSPGM